MYASRADLKRLYTDRAIFENIFDLNALIRIQIGVISDSKTRNDNEKHLRLGYVSGNVENVQFSVLLLSII